MKKVLLGALAAVALVACSKDDVVEVNRVNDQITYGAVVNSATRAANVYCNNNLPASFTVSAEHGGELYFANDVITVNPFTGACTSSATRYWPNSGDVTFYAHVNGTMTYTAGSAPQFKDFTVADDVADQQDLMYAVQKQGKSESAVALNFRHALSQIVFAAKNTSENMYVEVSGVTLCNVNNDANTYTFPLKATTTNIEDHVGVANPSFTYDDSWGAWETLPTEGDVEFGTTFSAVGLVGGKAAVSLTNVADGANENAMLLIPQNTSAWVPATYPTPSDSSNTGSYLLVKCIIYNVAVPNGSDAKGGKTNDDVCLWGEEVAGAWVAKEVAVPITFNWEQGKKYIYTLVFGSGVGGYDPDPEDPADPEPVLVPISYTITVDDFVFVDGGEVQAGM